MGFFRRGDGRETPSGPPGPGPSPPPPTPSWSGPHELPGRTLGTGKPQPAGSVADPRPGEPKGSLPGPPSVPGVGPRAVTCEGRAAPPHPPRAAAPSSPSPPLARRLTHCASVRPRATENWRLMLLERPPASPLAEKYLPEAKSPRCWDLEPDPAASGIAPFTSGK